MTAAALTFGFWSLFGVSMFPQVIEDSALAGGHPPLRLHVLACVCMPCACMTTPLLPTRIHACGSHVEMAIVCTTWALPLSLHSPETLSHACMQTPWPSGPP